MTTPELTYVKYADVVVYLRPFLDDAGYTEKRCPVKRGPVDDLRLKETPDAMLFITVGGGPGLSKEGMFDRVLITTRAVGRQKDYDDAERLAYVVDAAFLSFPQSELLGSVYALSIDRTGGAPTLLLRDSAERYHFPGSYITETETGL